MASARQPLPFTAEQLSTRYAGMRAQAKNRFLTANFPRKLFEGPLNGGRFDVEYLPQQNELKVYLKVFFNFVASSVDDSQIATAIPGDNPTWYRKTGKRRRWRNGRPLLRVVLKVFGTAPISSFAVRDQGGTTLPVCRS